MRSEFSDICIWHRSRTLLNRLLYRRGIFNLLDRVSWMAIDAIAVALTYLICYCFFRVSYVSSKLLYCASTVIGVVKYILLMGVYS